jgi:hypothetical protein
MNTGAINLVKYPAAISIPPTISKNVTPQAIAEPIIKPLLLRNSPNPFTVPDCCEGNGSNHFAI